MRAWWLVLLLFLLPACTAKQNAEAQKFVGTDVSDAKFGADFSLVDADGNPRKLSDFRGKVVALFFGYTHCPDVCPTTLADLARARKLLGPRGKDFQVLFVTLDPERDSAEILKKYIPSFDADFIGLRGDAETTRKTAQDFKVFYAKQEPGSNKAYTLDHSAGVYVFDRRGSLRLYLGFGQSARDIAHDVSFLL
jgi:protein SCO1/2